MPQCFRQRLQTTLIKEFDNTVLLSTEYIYVVQCLI